MNSLNLAAALVLTAVLARGQFLRVLGSPFVTAETQRLVFHAAQTHGGPLAQQVQDSVKQLKRYGRIVKLRAFVPMGSSKFEVGEALKKMFPAKSGTVLNLVAVARLPDPAAQVLIEGVSESKKIENPNGLVFISGQMTQSPLDPSQTSRLVAPLGEKSIVSLKTIVKNLDDAPEDVVRVNCFTSSLEDHLQLESLVVQSFPNASVSVMQVQRALANQFVECEAVARMRNKITDSVRLVNPTQAAFAQAAIVTAPKIVFTTTYLPTFIDYVPPFEDLVQGALSELKTWLERGGSSIGSAFYVYAYPGTAAALDKYRNIRFEFLDRAKAPASTNLVFDGETLGIDAIALPLN